MIKKNKEEKRETRNCRRMKDPKEVTIRLIMKKRRKAKIKEKTPGIIRHTL